MNAISSMMELNPKSPFIWDWENLVMFNPKSVEAPKKLQLVDSEIDGIEGFEVYFSGGQGDCGRTGSDLGYASSSRSSKSASGDSSTDREVKETKFTLETNDSFQNDYCRSKRELVNSSGITRTSSTIESSAVSGESLIALELGIKRTYFEDVSGANNAAKNSTLSSIFPNLAAKKSKSSAMNTQIPRCQVEGCNLDLFSAKDYHRKHRVCESHSKSPKVVINGVERRFCQQCSRFHGLSEFDQKKRSCRRRLSDHNARRRKPKPEVIQFNSMRLGSSLYGEGRNQLSFAFNQTPVVQNRHGAWDTTNTSKVVQQTKPSLFTTIKPVDETKVSPLSPHILPPSKAASSDVFQRGVAVSMAPSNMVDAAQNLRALSLLSTSSWGSCDQPEPSPLDHHHNHPMHANQATLAQPLPAMNAAVSLAAPPVPSEFWQAAEQQPVPSVAGSHASTFQLFKAPNEPEPTFYLY